MDSREFILGNPGYSNYTRNYKWREAIRHMTIGIIIENFKEQLARIGGIELQIILVYIH